MGARQQAMGAPSPALVGGARAVHGADALPWQRRRPATRAQPQPRRSSAHEFGRKGAFAADQR
eukprot:3608786-Prymnesium_polylepis.2